MGVYRIFHVFENVLVVVVRDPPFVLFQVVLEPGTYNVCWCGFYTEGCDGCCSRDTEFSVRIFELGVEGPVNTYILPSPTVTESARAHNYYSS